MWLNSFICACLLPESWYSVFLILQRLSFLGELSDINSCGNLGGPLLGYRNVLDIAKKRINVWNGDYARKLWSSSSQGRKKTDQKQHSSLTNWAPSYLSLRWGGGGLRRGVGCGVGKIELLGQGFLRKLMFFLCICSKFKFIVPRKWLL